MENPEGEKIEKIDSIQFRVAMCMSEPDFFNWPREAYYVHAEPLRKKLIDEWKNSK